MPKPLRPPDPTPEEIAERAAIVKAESLERKRQSTPMGHHSKVQTEHNATRTPRVYRLTIAKNGDQM